MHTFAIIIALTFLFTITFPLAGRLLKPGDMVDKLPPGRLEPLRSYVSEDAEALTDAAFWAASAQLRGIRQRLRDATLLIGALQERVARSEVTLGDAWEVWKLTICQLCYSLLAFPEALLCRALPIPHLMALGAAELHWRATLRTYTLCYRAPWLSNRDSLL